MIDTSDGLTDLAHICEESGVGAEAWEAEAVPRARVGKPAYEVDLNWPCTAAKTTNSCSPHPAENRKIPSRIVGVPVTQIGQITRTRKILLRNHRGVAHELEPLRLGALPSS